MNIKQLRESGALMSLDRVWKYLYINILYKLYDYVYLCHLLYKHDRNLKLKT